MTAEARVTSLETTRKHEAKPDRIEMNLASQPWYWKWHRDMGDCVLAEQEGRPPSPEGIHALIVLRVAIRSRGELDRPLQPSDILAAIAELEPITPDAPRMPQIASPRDESTQDAQIPTMPVSVPRVDVVGDAPLPATRRRVTRKRYIPASLHYRDGDPIR